MAVAAVVAPRDVGQHAQLVRRQRAVGNGDPQHVGVQLQIEAVHQPQRLELVLGQLAGQAARDLVAEFRDALGDQRPVEVVVEVHGRSGPSRWRAARWSGRRADAFAQIAGAHAAVRRELDRGHIGADRAADQLWAAASRPRAPPPQS